MSRRWLATTAAFALGLSVAAATLRAQNVPATYLGQLQTQLGLHATDFTNRGYSPMGAFQAGSLRPGNNITHQVELTAGRQYGVLGVCDNDCSDVDLTLYSPSGSQVAQDVATDDYPELQFTAPETGSYRLVVAMVQCRTAPCYYMVQLYGGSGGQAMGAPMGGQPMNQPVPLQSSVAVPNTMGMIALNQQVNGSLSYGDQRYDNKPIQAWGFNCTAGQSFQMDILSSWDNYGVVFDPNGNVVARDDDSGGNLNSRINQTCSMTGMYRLGITVYSASTTPGAYTLQVQGVTMNQPAPINQPQPMNQPTPMPMGAANAGNVAAPGAIAQIAIGQTMAGRLEVGDRVMTDSTWADIWQFQGNAGQQITIELRSTEFDAYLQLLDGNNNRLAEDDDSAGNLDARITYTLPTTGAYQIICNNYGDRRRAGNYTLTLR